MFNGVFAFAMTTQYRPIAVFCDGLDCDHSRNAWSKMLTSNPAKTVMRNIGALFSQIRLAVVVPAHVFMGLK